MQQGDKPLAPSAAHSSPSMCINKQSKSTPGVAHMPWCNNGIHGSGSQLAQLVLVNVEAFTCGVWSNPWAQVGRLVSANQVRHKFHYGPSQVQGGEGGVTIQGIGCSLEEYHIPLLMVLQHNASVVVPVCCTSPCNTHGRIQHTGTATHTHHNDTAPLLQYDMLFVNHVHTVT